jgi:hypothetical protein
MVFSHMIASSDIRKTLLRCKTFPPTVTFQGAKPRPSNAPPDIRKVPLPHLQLHPKKSRKICTQKITTSSTMTSTISTTTTSTMATTRSSTSRSTTTHTATHRQQLQSIAFASSLVSTTLSLLLWEGREESEGEKMTAHGAKPAHRRRG